MADPRSPGNTHGIPNDPVARNKYAPAFPTRKKLSSIGSWQRLTKARSRIASNSRRFASGRIKVRFLFRASDFGIPRTEKRTREAGAMQKQEKQRSLAKRARKYWEQRDLSALEALRREPQAEAVSEVQYFLGLALNACNKRRDAIQCWRRATELDPRNEDAIRTLAYRTRRGGPKRGRGAIFLLGRNAEGKC